MLLDKKERSAPPDEFVSSCNQISDIELGPHENPSAVTLAGPHEESKSLLDSSEFVIQRTDLKQDGLLLPPSEQVNR